MLPSVATRPTGHAARRTVTLTGRDGLRLVGETRGDPAAAPIVFLHGSGQSRHSWTASAKALADDGWHTVTLDLRGHGDSERARDGAYRLEDFRDDVLAVIRKLERPPVLVGASMGGSLALMAAAELAADRIRGIVLADSAHRGDEAGQAALTEFARGAADGYAGIEQAGQALAGLQLGSGDPLSPDRLRQLLREADGRYWWPWDPAFAQLWASLSPGERDANADRVLTAARGAGCPILLVRGAASRLVTEEVADEFCEHVPGTRRLDLVGVGHMLTGDDNSSFVEAIEPFLAELDGRP